MNKTFQFGQYHPDYAVMVLNERAVRASAGILFFFGLDRLYERLADR